MNRVPFSLAVPASMGNLGPGFDTLGLALSLYLHVRVTDVVDDNRSTLTCDFGDVAPDGENLIAQAYRRMADRHGAGPSLRVTVRSAIPMKAGLGSSAAAIVAGLRLYEAVTKPCELEELLATAAALEGHPDNTSPALLGGLTVSCVDEAGRVTALASPWPERVRVVVATPETRLETKAARDVLPSTVSRSDAVFNLQRVALLLQAVHAGRVDLLRTAVQDRLHQPFRTPLVPGLYDALRLEDPALVGVFLSGAGPSISALVDGNSGPVVRLFEELYSRLGVSCVVRDLSVHQPVRPSDTMPAIQEPVIGQRGHTRQAPKAL
ncbi:MAG: homoserine kinase [Luteitalea sp.]|nr:homoserine kinase [Luteitalea sp.]